MDSYYGLTDQGKQVKYNGPIVEIPLDGNDTFEASNKILQDVPLAHLIIVASLGLLIVIKSNTEFSGFHIRTAMDVTGTSKIMSSVIAKGRKFDMLEKYGAIELK